MVVGGSVGINSAIVCVCVCVCACIHHTKKVICVCVHAWEGEIVYDMFPLLSKFILGDYLHISNVSGMHTRKYKGTYVPCMDDFN